LLQAQLELFQKPPAIQKDIDGHLTQWHQITHFKELLEYLMKLAQALLDYMHTMQQTGFRFKHMIIIMEANVDVQAATAMHRCGMDVAGVAVFGEAAVAVAVTLMHIFGIVLDQTTIHTAQYI
jgi:hypothetical protein